jgi:hypothetical protein
MTSKIEVHSTDEGFVVERTQRFDGLVDTCKALHNEGFHGTSDMRPLMSVPGVMIEAWCEKRGVTFAEFNRDAKLQSAFINDPDLSAFRIWKGKA